jgi:3-oxoacyl-[acyl-carrier protein] reductase
MRLKGKTAFISGAGRNSGKAIALAFAREGADLILIARQLGDELNKVATECESLGAKTLPLLADVSDPAQVERVTQLAVQRFGKIDVLASVAAVRPHRQFWEYSYEEWHHVFAVNLHALFYLAKALAPGMMERRSGSIIALGSVAGMTGLPNVAVEVASKHGLHGLVKSLALELGPYNVRANLLNLSYIDNDRRNPEWYVNDPLHRTSESRAKLEHERTPLRRTGKPHEVANAAVFLASDDSSYVTGDRLVCAGGRYM